MHGSCVTKPLSPFTPTHLLQSAFRKPCEQCLSDYHPGIIHYAQTLSSLQWFVVAAYKVLQPSRVYKVFLLYDLTAYHLFLILVWVSWNADEGEWREEICEQWRAKCKE